MSASHLHCALTGTRRRNRLREGGDAGALEHEADGLGGIIGGGLADLEPLQADRPVGEFLKVDVEEVRAPLDLGLPVLPIEVVDDETETVLLLQLAELRGVEADLDLFHEVPSLSFYDSPAQPKI
jgi:hypothetical protein